MLERLGGVGSENDTVKSSKKAVTIQRRKYDGFEDEDDNDDDLE